MQRWVGEGVSRALRTAEWARPRPWSKARQATRMGGCPGKVLGLQALVKWSLDTRNILIASKVL